MGQSPTIVWFRRDLRIEDNPALHAAVSRGRPVIPLFVWASAEDTPWQPGAASRVWLHHSLTFLAGDLAAVGMPLVLRKGDSEHEIRAIVQSTGADAVYWNRLYEPSAIARDERAAASLEGVAEVRIFKGGLLFEPWEVTTQAGDPYKVFTPFWKYCVQQVEPDDCLAAPRSIELPETLPEGLEVGDLGLLPSLDWAQGIREEWHPGERGAQDQLGLLLDHALAGYEENHDFPGIRGTSQLSPHLHFGEIGPRQVWHAVHAAAAGASSGFAEAAHAYLRQLGWREFAHHLLYHFPETSHAPLREKFQAFPWRVDTEQLTRWQRGQTGYPIVDAGMRQLWHCGWMHNRVRMIVASFLTKDLLIPWQEGAKWFWDTLVDADLANNTLGWQWTAGCGADAAPYFRIFNPVTQAARYDPEAEYVRKWVPELASLDNQWIHRPFAAPEEVLGDAGVVLGETYPHPIVDHKAARQRALAAYEAIK